MSLKAANDRHHPAPSLPGLTRQSMVPAGAPVPVDARVKPGHDN